MHEAAVFTDVKCEECGQLMLLEVRLMQSDRFAVEAMLSLPASSRTLATRLGRRCAAVRSFSQGHRHQVALSQHAFPLVQHDWKQANSL